MNSEETSNENPAEEMSVPNSLGVEAIGDFYQSPILSGAAVFLQDVYLFFCKISVRLFF